MTGENAISTSRNVLLVLGDPRRLDDVVQRVIGRFCGEVYREVPGLEELRGKHVYACGDVHELPDGLEDVRVVDELGAGKVPLLVHGVGVLYERFFDEEDLFTRISGEHVFQNLTESTKGSKALRTGIYLTDVARDAADDALHFRLLRCSSNLTGPTDNFRATDRMAMGAINRAAREVFERETSLNHVLAQVYENTVDEGERRKERKAKISAHSDKTKDMRADGLIAFCTFYDPAGFTHLTPSETDPRDWCFGKTSGLTRLHFKLKPDVADADLAPEFSVTLYPNSVFIIPLSTNRLYTHAVRPSQLNVERIPTRMGYVARSSKAEALHRDGQTFLKEGGELLPLVPMTDETLTALRSSYYQENRTADEVAYGEVRFSMNEGDYMEPIH